MATFSGDEGNNSLFGGADNDVIDGFGGNDSLQGGDGSDTVRGGAGNDTVGGNGGTDWVEGGSGNDTVTGGGGQDSFAFHEYGAANADLLTDFGGGWDNLQLDAAAFAAIGATGRFASGDVRFYAAAGATGGHDADDRIVYNTSTGQLFYDADGDGAGAAQLIATFGGGVNVAASDITVFGTATPTPTPVPTDRVITGTSGNDSLVGGSGNDTIDGLAGNDTLTGGGGADRFYFTVTPGNANGDTITDLSASDFIVLDARVMPALGESGQFSADDARFYSYAQSSDHNFNGPIFYNYTTGYVYYEPDGMGASTPAQLLFSVQPFTALEAQQFIVINGTVGITVNGTTGSDSLAGGNGNDAINGFAGNDTLLGGAGNDTLDGGSGSDTMIGGLGDDTYIVDSVLDWITDAGGRDTVLSSVSFDGSRVALENVTLTGTAPSNVLMSSMDNVIRGNDAANYLDGGGGDDTILGGGGNDTIVGSLYGYRGGAIDGGAGLDQLTYAGGGSSRIEVDLSRGTVAGGDYSSTAHATITGVEDVLGGAYSDRLIGDRAANWLYGASGDDTIDGGAGVDTLIGAGGADTFYLTAAPGDANADFIGDFATGTDKIRVDTAVMPGLGALGNFSPADVRFYAAPGASGGHDADDRIVYDTSTGRLYYDGDGSAPGAAQLVATLQGAPTLVASDIAVGVFGTGDVAGTSGNDSIVGGFGNDTLRGLEGNDTLDGNQGTDLLLGGAGNDSLIGGGSTYPERDTLSGGLGNDTLSGGGSYGIYLFDVAPGAANADVITDASLYNSNITLDGTVFANIGASGNFTLNDDRWYAAAGATSGHDATDRVILDTTGKALYYDADGSGPGAAELIATLANADAYNYYSLPSAPTMHVVNGDLNMVLQGGYGDSLLQGGPGNDSIYGSGYGETLNGAGGNDLLDGHGGADVLTGGAGTDLFIFGTPYSDLQSAASRITDFASGVDAIRLDGSTLISTGPSGNLTAGDGRFYAAPGATAAHDANDRIVYDTSSGKVYYDDDGTGQDVPWVLFTVPVGTALAATDFQIVSGSVDTTINGTAGDDSITGGNAHDTINGGDGNDTLGGGPGNDSIDGGAGDDWLGGGYGNDTIVGGGGNDNLAGGGGRDLLIGGDGNDTLATSYYYSDEGPDTLQGGLGDDTYLINYKYAGQDTIIDTGGIDTIDTYIYWTLGPGFENLVLRIADESGPLGVGNELNNVIRSVNGYYKAGFAMDGGDGNDTLLGCDNNDTFLFRAGSGNYGNDVVDGGGGDNRVTFTYWDGVSGVNGYATSGVTIDLRHGTLTGGMTSGSATLRNIEDATGGGYGDHLIAHDGMTFVDRYGTETRGAWLDGGGGDDTIEGGASKDQLTGGDGADAFVFTSAPSDASADLITDFASGTDRIWLDATVMPALGARGSFVANDARFYAAAGATGGHDADDRIVFDTTTGKLYYDADGSGAGAAQLIATVNVTSPNYPYSPAVGNLAASDIVVINGTAPGVLVNGTAGDDSLLGGPGNDTLSGFDGNDTLDGGAGADSMVGGNGDDVYIVDNLGDLLVEQTNAGIDEARSSVGYTLPDWVNNLTLTGSAISGTGNAIDNVITGNGLGNILSGGDANDTLIGAGGSDTLTGGAGADTFVFNGAPDGDRVMDFASGSDTLRLDGAAFSAAGASGRFAGGDVRFYSAPGANAAHDADDRFVYNSSTGQLWYDADGNGSGGAQLVATLDAAPSLAASDLEVVNGTPTPTPTPTPGQSIGGTAGNDTLVGGSGNDTIFGNSGNDWIEGRGGNDLLSGGSGQDSYVFREYGVGNADTIGNFDGNGWDNLRFDGTAFGALGGAGHFAASDARFYAAAGATGGHDGDDRLVYNTSTGQLYYDADGSGAGAAQLVATLPSGATLVASDIWVI